MSWKFFFVPTVRIEDINIRKVSTTKMEASTLKMMSLGLRQARICGSLVVVHLKRLPLKKKGFPSKSEPQMIPDSEKSSDTRHRGELTSNHMKTRSTLETPFTLDLRCLILEIIFLDRRVIEVYERISVVSPH